MVVGIGNFFFTYMASRKNRPVLHDVMNLYAAYSVLLWKNIYCHFVNNNIIHGLFFITLLNTAQMKNQIKATENACFM